MLKFAALCFVLMSTCALASPYALNTTWDYCFDNTTLQVHTANYNNGTFSHYNDTYLVCQNGCEDSACNPPQWQSDLAIIVIIAVFVLIMWIFLRRKS